MEQLIVLLPIMGFIALAAGLLVVFRGTARIAARAREVERFRARVRDLAVRADTLLGAAAVQVDDVRHHRTGPETISQTLADATEALERSGEEARSWDGPRRVRSMRDDLVAELERAIRALALVEHGAGILASARRGAREMEAQTSIKRGYLNLIHAREAIARQALRAEDLAVGEVPSGRTGFDV